jgi:hypothetical protein
LIERRRQGAGHRREYCEACRATIHADCSQCEFRPLDLAPHDAVVWTVWCAAGTQWRSGPGGILGLDYPAVRLVAEALGFDWTPGLLRGLQLLEDDFLAELSDHASGTH